MTDQNKIPCFAGWTMKPPLTAGVSLRGERNPFDSEKVIPILGAEDSITLAITYPLSGLDPAAASFADNRLLLLHTGQNTAFCSHRETNIRAANATGRVLPKAL
jgi:hypothetical protein